MKGLAYLTLMRSEGFHPFPLPFSSLSCPLPMTANFGFWPPLNYPLLSLSKQIFICLVFRLLPFQLPLPRSFPTSYFRSLLYPGNRFCCCLSASKSHKLVIAPFQAINRQFHFKNSFKRKRVCISNFLSLMASFR